MSHAREYSPFTPDAPVPRELFVGRSAEIELILDVVARVKGRRRPEILFVSGERGIGKSSLCAQARRLAEERYECVGIQVLLGGVSEVEIVVERLFERLVAESVSESRVAAMKEVFGRYVKTADLFGLKLEFDDRERTLHEATSSFARVLAQITTKLPERNRCLLLIMDDLNGLAASDRFANWLKSFVDDAATNDLDVPVVMILVGLPERHEQLVQLQPSLTRVLRPITIEPFSVEEGARFFREAFGQVSVSIDESAAYFLSGLARGYPVFMHHLGDAALQEDTDDVIDRDDALRGLDRALRVIGAKLFQPSILKGLHSGTYRRILATIAKQGSEFSRSEVSSFLSAEDKRGLDNCLRRLERLGAIRKQPEGQKGSYEFSSPMHWLYFLSESETLNPS